MELKLPIGILPSIKSVVLIVPLWNWNQVNTNFLDGGEPGSNCTFMELKLLWKLIKVVYT